MINLAILIFQLALLFILSGQLKKQLYTVLFATTKNQMFTISILSILFFPGTAVHELSHLFIAGILFVPVGEMDLVPKVVKGTIRAGSVQIGKTDPFRQTIVGLAPIFVGLTLLYCIVRFLLPSQLLFTVYRLPFTSSPIFLPIPPLVQYSLALYLILTISTTMFSSQKDLTAAKIVLPVIAILAISAAVSSIHFPTFWISNLLGEIEAILQTLNFALAIANGLHLIFLFLLKVYSSTTLTTPVSSGLR